MLFLVLSIVFTIIGLVLASARIVTDKAGNDKLTFKIQAKTLLGLLPLLLIAFAMYASVPVNSTGILFNQVTGETSVIEQGMHIKSPLDTLYVISTEVREKTVEGLYAQTKDSQYVTIIVNLKYNVSEPSAVFKGFRTLKAVDEVLIPDLLRKTISEVTVRYNIIDILGVARADLIAEVNVRLQEELSAVGINFKYLTLVDTDAGEAIESAIVREAVAKKDAETALQAQEKARIEAATKVIEAEAAAKVTLIEAQTAADANKLLSFSITPEILKKMEMEARIKWGWVTITTGSAIVDTTK